MLAQGLSMNVNIGIDAKSLAEGVLIETQFYENGRLNFTTFGDVDIAFEDFNQKRDEIIGDLPHFYNQELDHENLYESLQYFQRLLDRVQKLKDQHSKAITYVSNKDKKTQQHYQDWFFARRNTSSQSPK